MQLAENRVSWLAVPISRERHPVAQQTQKPPTEKPNDRAEAKRVEEAAKAAEARKSEQAARVKAEEIRVAAERDAQKLKSAAERDAQKLKAAAERDAQVIKTSAEQDAKKIKAAAEAEARTTRKATEAEARKTEIANREARETEKAARDEAERVQEAATLAAQQRTEDPLAIFSFAQQQIEVTTQLTRALWAHNLELAAGMVPVYVNAYEQTVTGLKPFSRPAAMVRETAEAGATVAREFLTV